MSRAAVPTEAVFVLRCIVCTYCIPVLKDGKHMHMGAGSRSLRFKIPSSTAIVVEESYHQAHDWVVLSLDVIKR